MDCSLPGSSVHGILWARILEWVPMPSSRESSPPRDRTHIFYIFCIAGGFTTTEPPGKPLIILPLITQSHTSSNCPISDNSSIFFQLFKGKTLGVISSPTPPKCTSSPPTNPADSTFEVSPDSSHSSLPPPTPASPNHHVSHLDLGYTS